MNPFIRMPDHWTPRQVELILDFIDDLYQAIWDQYGNEICLYWNAGDQREAGDGEHTNGVQPR